MSSTLTRFVGAAVAIAMLTGAAIADSAARCLPDLINVVNWSAKTYGEQQGLAIPETQIALGLHNNGSTDIVMVQGTVNFVDALGNSISPFPLEIDPDINIPASSPGNIANLAHRGRSRLVDIDKKMVSASVCITAVALADGSIVRASSH